MFTTSSFDLLVRDFLDIVLHGNKITEPYRNKLMKTLLVLGQVFVIDII
jgi:hypothetical protein